MKSNENLAEIPFTLTVDGNAYQCEVFFPDGSSYWEKQKLQNGMNMVIMCCLHPVRDKRKCFQGRRLR